MSNLDWEECKESGQATAKGNGVTYWLVESKGLCSLWVKPDTIDDGFTEWKGSATCCMQHADLIEANKEITELKAELTLTRNQLDNATAKLHGARKHRHEITSHNPNGSTTTAILLAGEENNDG